MQKGERKMIIIASNGTEVIDNRPEAEISYSQMEYAEERYKRRKRNHKKKSESFAHILASLF